MENPRDRAEVDTELVRVVEVEAAGGDTLDEDRIRLLDRERQSTFTVDVDADPVLCVVDVVAGAVAVSTQSASGDDGVDSVLHGATSVAGVPSA